MTPKKILILFLFLISFSFAASWTMDGGSVYWTQSGYTIRAYPAVSENPVQQTHYVNFSSTNPTPLTVNLSFVFDSPIQDANAYLLKRFYRQDGSPLYGRVSAIMQLNISSYTQLNSSPANCKYGDSQNTKWYNVNLTNGTNLNACFDSVTANGQLYTINYSFVGVTGYNQTYVPYDDWGLISSTFTHHTILGHEVYTVNNVDFNSTTNYQAKFVYSPTDSSGKFSIYAHTGSPYDVVNGNANVYVVLDPWWNNSCINKIAINITTNTTSNIEHFLARIDLNTSDTSIWNSTTCANGYFVNSSETGTFPYDIKSADPQFCGNTANKTTYFVDIYNTTGNVTQLFYYICPKTIAAQNSTQIWTNMNAVLVYLMENATDRFGVNNLTAVSTVTYRAGGALASFAAAYNTTSAYLKKDGLIPVLPTGTNPYTLITWAKMAAAPTGSPTQCVLFAYGDFSTNNCRLGYYNPASGTDGNWQIDRYGGQLSRVYMKNAWLTAPTMYMIRMNGSNASTGFNNTFNDTTGSFNVGNTNNMGVGAFEGGNGGQWGGCAANSTQDFTLVTNDYKTNAWVAGVYFQNSPDWNGWTAGATQQQTITSGIQFVSQTPSDINSTNLFGQGVNMTFNSTVAGSYTNNFSYSIAGRFPYDATAYYSFNDGNGTDDSGHGLTATISGAQNATGASGLGMAFNGAASTTINLPNSQYFNLSSTNGFTICAKPIPSTPQGGNYLITKVAAYSLEIQSTLGARFLAYNGSSYQSSGYAAYQNNTINSFCGQFNGTHSLIYVNGQLKNSALVNGFPANSTFTPRIGNFNLANGFNGTIDEVYFFNRTLSLAEIQSLNNSGLIWQNGTNVQGWSNYVPQSGNLSGNISWYRLFDNQVYPAVYAYPNETYMEIQPKTNFTLGNTASYISTELIGFSNTTLYNFYEFDANGTTGLMTAWYCNSSYAFNSGVSTSANCAQIGQIAASANFNHTHGTNSSHMLLPFTIINGLVGTVAVTQTGYMMLEGSTGTVNMRYIADTTRATTTKTTTNGGVSWTNQTFTADNHVHQFDSIDTLYYYLQSQNSTNAYNSTYQSDNLDLTLVPPTPGLVTSPTQAFNRTSIAQVNYTNATSANNASIKTIKISLYYANITFVKVLTANNTQSLTYNYNTTNESTGEYVIQVNYTDANNLTASSYSPFFAVFNRTLMSAPPFYDTQNFTQGYSFIAMNNITNATATLTYDGASTTVVNSNVTSNISNIAVITPAAETGTRTHNSTWTFTLVGAEGNYTYTENTSVNVSQGGFFLCTPGVTNQTTVLYSFFDSVSLASINATLQAQFAYTKPGGSHAIDSVTGTNNSVYVCILPNNASITATASDLVNSTGYATLSQTEAPRTYTGTFFVNSIFLTPIGAGQFYTLVIQNTYSAAIPGASLIGYHFISANNSWVQFATATTDTTGSAVFFMTPANLYNFTINATGYNYALVSLTPGSATTIIIQLTQSNVPNVTTTNLFNDTQYSLTPASGYYNTSTQTVTFTVSNNASTLSNWGMWVIANSSYGLVVFNQTSNSSTGGTMSYVMRANSSYTAYAWINHTRQPIINVEPHLYYVTSRSVGLAIVQNMLQAGQVVSGWTFEFIALLCSLAAGIAVTWKLNFAPSGGAWTALIVLAFFTMLAPGLTIFGIVTVGLANIMIGGFTVALLYMTANM